MSVPALSAPASSSAAVVDDPALNPNLASLLTINGLAARHGQRPTRIRHAILQARIAPLARVGTTLVYSPADEPRIIRELQRLNAKKPVATSSLPQLATA